MSVKTAHAQKDRLSQRGVVDSRPQAASHGETCSTCKLLSPPPESPPPLQWDLEFAETVSPLLGQLQRLARQILRSHDAAEDAVQEALTSLWREGRLPPNPKGWLSRAVIHRSLHLNRSRKRRRCHEERACVFRRENDDDGNAARLIESKELGILIKESVSQLPEHLREVVRLRAVEQMDYRSIADLLKIPVGTVRSRLSRAREALVKSLGEPEDSSQLMSRDSGEPKGDPIL